MSDQTPIQRRHPQSDEWELYYHGNGIVFCHFHFDPVRRCPRGHAFWNYPNGRRMADGYYNEGIRASRWRWEDEEGNVLQVVDFGDGEYIKPPPPEKLDLALVTPETTIILDEEWGYKEWFWIPDRPLHEIVEWWKTLSGVTPWTFSPQPLPGVLVEARSGEEYDLYYKAWRSGRYYTAHLNDDSDSWLRPPGEEEIHNQGGALAREYGVG